MKSQLIATAITLAIALSASSSFAAGAPAPAAPPAGGGASNVGSNAGTNVGSNAGTNVGSNAGTHAGSNAGTTVGSNAGTNVGSNAGTHIGSNATTNTPNNASRTVAPNNTAANPYDHARRMHNRYLVFPGFFGGDYGIYDTTGSPAGYNPNTNPAPESTAGSTNAINPTSANTASIPPAQLSPDGQQTTANVPPARDYTNASPQNTLISPRPTQLEGQLVDLYSATETVPAPAQPPTPAPAATTTVLHPVAAPGTGNSPTAGLTEAVGSISKVSDNSFGTTVHPGTLTPAPVSAPTISTNKPEISVIVPPGNATPAARAYDDAAITKQLKAGMPAAIVVHGRVYTLVCDPQQLAPYAGATLRVTGRITSSGALIPSSIEYQLAGKYHAIALTHATNNTATAAEQ